MGGVNIVIWEVFALGVQAEHLKVLSVQWAGLIAMWPGSLVVAMPWSHCLYLYTYHSSTYIYYGHTTTLLPSSPSVNIMAINTHDIEQTKGVVNNDVGRGPVIFRRTSRGSKSFSGGGEPFELFYFKYECQYYGMAMQLGAWNLFLRMMVDCGNFTHVWGVGEGTMNLFYNHWTFQPTTSPPSPTMSLIVDQGHCETREADQKIVRHHLDAN